MFHHGGLSQQHVPIRHKRESPLADSKVWFQLVFWASGLLLALVPKKKSLKNSHVFIMLLFQVRRRHKLKTASRLMNKDVEPWIQSRQVKRETNNRKCSWFSKNFKTQISGTRLKPTLFDIQNVSEYVNIVIIIRFSKCFFWKKKFPCVQKRTAYGRRWLVARHNKPRDSQLPVRICFQFNHCFHYLKTNFIIFQNLYFL